MNKVYKLRKNISPPTSPIHPPPNTLLRLPMYQLHKFWSRKAWYLVRGCIEHFTQPGEVIFDPFCGSGVVAAESLITGRKVICNDLNPFAVFLTKMTCLSPVDIQELIRTFEHIRSSIVVKIMDFYKIDKRCLYCNEPLYTRWVGRGEKWFEQHEKEYARIDCIKCGKFTEQRVLDNKEIKRIKESEKQDIPHWYPQSHIPRFVQRKGNTRVDQLFNKRNLIAVSILFNEINNLDNGEIKDLLKLAFTSSLHFVSKLNTVGNAGRWAINNHWIPPDYIEENVWLRFEDRFWKIVEGKKQTNQLIKNCNDGNLRLYNESADELKEVGDETVDYVFTDPPYGDQVPYFGLTTMWNGWLGLNGKSEKEITIDPYQKKRENEYRDMLKRAFGRIYRALKPNHWMSVTFANKNPKIWKSLLDSCLEAGFEFVNVFPQKPITQSYRQVSTKIAPKTDLVINFYKSDGTHHKKPMTREAADFEEIVTQIAEDIIEENGKVTTSEVLDGVIGEWLSRQAGSVDNLNIKFDLSLDSIEQILEGRYKKPVEYTERVFDQLTLFEGEIKYEGKKVKNKVWVMRD